MIYEDVSAFANKLHSNNSLICLDLGTKTIGVAVSDTILSVATPIKTIKRKKFSTDADQLLEIISIKNCCGVVVGLPKNMDGSEGPRAQSTRAFARNFSAKTQLPDYFLGRAIVNSSSRKSFIRGGYDTKNVVQK